MTEMVFLIAVARCLASNCEFYYPAPDMQYANYEQCKDDAKVFDFYLAIPYWTDVTCVQVPRVWVGYPTQRRR